MKPTRESACAVISIGSLFPRPDESLAALLQPLSPAGRSGQLLRMDRLCGLSLCAADQALLAPATIGRFDASATAVLIGSAYGCHKSDEDFYRGRLDGQPSPRLFAYTLPSSPVGEVSIHHGLLGPGLSIVTGRTAGLEALGQAEALLLARQATACLVLACEVAAPAVYEHAEDAALCDGAVAVLLGLADEADDRGHLAGSATAFRANDPAAAIVACIDEVFAHEPLSRSATRICDPQTHSLIRGAIDPGQVEVYATAPCGAASAVAIFASLSALPESTGADYLVLSADPCGMAAAVLWRRIS